MKFLNKLERRFGRYAIHNLIVYVIGLYIAGVVIQLINPTFYYLYLMLDFNKIAQGQVWRLITFLIQPPAEPNLFVIFTLYLYYMIGRSLENAWGAFRFNLYFFSGVIFNILAAFIIYMATGLTGYYVLIPLDYINQAMFFAFAALYGDVQLLLMFVIPIKVKYIAYIYGAIFGYNVIDSFASGNWRLGVVMLVAIANFLIFFLTTRNYRKYSPQQIKRKVDYKRQVRNAHNPDNVVQFRGKSTITRHKCAVCGRTELDDDSLEFRFCSKCDGNYEYCMDHLYTHEHVHRDPEQKDS